VLELDAQTHDEVVAAISHLPQMIATSLVEMVGQLHEEKGYFLTLAAGGFRDLTRIASSPYAPVWEDICRTNEDQIGRMIDQYIALLQDVRQRLADPSLGRDFAFANRTRNSIPRDAKGFIHTLSELLVVAEDKPGVISQIAQALAQERININDIEVMKVREGEGGTLRLGFDSQPAADHALEVLARLGYQARRR
jgi:prephenate dehydrogenase